MQGLFNTAVSRQANPYCAADNRCELQTQWLIGQAARQRIDLKGAHVLWLASRFSPAGKTYLSPTMFGDEARHGWRYHVVLEVDNKVFDLSLVRPRPTPMASYLEQAIPGNRRNEVRVHEVPVSEYQRRFPAGTSAFGFLHQFKGLLGPEYVAARQRRAALGIPGGISGQ